MTSNTLKVDCPSHCTTPSERVDSFPVQNIKVGCLSINPASTVGRRHFMLQMLVLSFVPHAALILQNVTIMAQLSTTLDSSLNLHTEVGVGLAAGEGIMVIQQERLMVFYYVFSTSSEEMYEMFNKSELQEVFEATDYHLSSLPENLVPEQLQKDLKELIRTSIVEELAVYDAINSALLLYMSRPLKNAATTFARHLTICYQFTKSVESLILTVTMSILQANVQKGLDFQTLALFQYHQLSALEHLNATQQLLEDGGFHNEKRVLQEIIQFFEESALSVIKTSEGFSKTVRFRGNLEYLKDIRCLQKLKIIHQKLWAIVQASIRNEVWLARRTLCVGIIILAIVLIVSPILILLIRHIVNALQVFTTSIEDSTLKIAAEKQKSDLLLSRMLPIPVLKRLRAQRTVPAEGFDAVTIFFSDIVGFTAISAKSTPMEVINMLNMLYRLFDEKITKYNVYKVETIGDAYMVVSGLPQRNGNRHASEIADMSLALMRGLDGARVPHMPDEFLLIRAGVNTGSCVAGVVGTTMPRYCLFGDTINTASRMESTGEASKIHISQTTKEELDKIGGYETVSRGFMDVPGKGAMETFWLVGKTEDQGPPSPKPKLTDYDQNFIDLLFQ